MKNKFIKKGTTLLEILIYFAIVGIVLLSAMSFSIQIFSTGAVSKNLNELNTNLQFLTEKIISEIQTADSVNANLSVFDNDQGTLALSVQPANDSPTIFDFDNGNITMKEGAGTAIQLNSDLVTVNLLRFSRLTYSKSPDQIVIDITISSNDSDVTKFKKSMSAHLSVSLRKP